MNKRSKSDKESGRDYRHEYDYYQGTDEQKKRRALRNRDRRRALAEGKVTKHDDKDIHHAGGGLTKPTVRDRSKNRADKKKR